MPLLRRLVLLLALGGAPVVLLAQSPDTVKVGLWLKSLYDMDLSGGAYNTNFWLWFVYRSDSIAPAESAEVTNAKAFEFAQASVEKKGGLNWASQEVRAEMKQIWDVNYFPFDRQVLTIEVEDAQNDLESVVYLADTANSTYSKEIELDGWKIESFEVSTTEHHYATNFGDPTLAEGGSDYPQLTAQLTIRRNGWGLFFKLFTGVYVAFFISWLAFFVPPTEVDPRFGLSVGGLFGAVGNKYLVDSILPDIISTSLSDRIHGLTFAMLLSNVVVSVISLYYAKQERTATYKRIDRTAAAVLVVIFLIINVIFIAQAAR